MHLDQCLQSKVQRLQAASELGRHSACALLLQAKIALVHMFRSFEFRLAPGQIPIKIKHNMTMSPQQASALQACSRMLMPCEAGGHSSCAVFQIKHLASESLCLCRACMSRCTGARDSCY